jgi:hypothetical protein
MTIRSLFAICLLVGLVSFAGCKEDKKLKVTGIEPSTGDFQGGTKITIKGNRFTKDGSRAASVYFGGKKADVLGFGGDSQLIVKTPGGNPGEKVDVLIIFEPGGEITLKQAYTYVEEKAVDVKDLDTSKTK